MCMYMYILACVKDTKGEFQIDPWGRSDRRIRNHGARGNVHIHVVRSNALAGRELVGRPLLGPPGYPKS